MSDGSTEPNTDGAGELERRLHERMLSLIDTYEDELRDAVRLVHGRIESLNRLRHPAAASGAEANGAAPMAASAFSHAVDDLIDQVEGLERRVVTSLRALEFANRRKEIRVPVDIEATVIHGTTSQLCRIENLSAGGAQVYAVGLGAKAFDLIELRIERIGDIAGKVVDTRPDILHVQFRQPNPQVLSQISQTLEHFGAKDRPLIAALKNATARIGHLFEAALAHGEVTLDDLFDTDYQPVPDTAPQQYLARFTALTDRLLPPIQETMFDIDHRVVFCAAVDRNGYLPTHNRIYSQSQRSGDFVWNAANARNRRIFDDSTGITAARNREPLLIQTYRRDMGGGSTILMKDLSVPIFVQGRHWGGLRLGCRILD